MSLDWSITDVKDWEAISMREENGLEATKTNALIWATMSVDLPGITAKNVDEFFWRLKVAEKYTGAFLYKMVEGQQEDYFFTKEDIERRIGLSTNVATVPRTSWVARVVKNLLRKHSELDGPSLKRELLASAPKAVKKAKKASAEVTA